MKIYQFDQTTTTPDLCFLTTLRCQESTTTHGGFYGAALCIKKRLSSRPDTRDAYHSHYHPKMWFFFKNLLSFTKYLPSMLSCLSMTLLYSLQARIHSLSYRALSNAKDIVLIYCDFPGVHLASRFASTVPTGYKVTLIEQNSHFNYVV